MKVGITFTEEMLGTQSANPEIHAEFIASKSADADKQAEEMAALPANELLEKAMTVFPTENSLPFLWDYQIKGFFKDACGMLSRIKTSKSSKLRAYKKIIDGLIFVYPRKINLLLPEGAEIGACQRPLRGQTAQGERIALVHSETVPIGTKAMFEVTCFDPAHEELVKEWLDYGILRGMGQWRNSGKGKFSYKEIA